MSLQRPHIVVIVSLVASTAGEAKELRCCDYQSTAVKIADTTSHHRVLFAIAWASSFRISPVSLAKESG